MSEDLEIPAPAEDEGVNIATDPVTSMRCENCDAQFDISDLAPFTNIECPHCEHRSQVPAQLGQFRLVRLLGMGGMGGVFHAYDETLGRYVAIKVMLKSLGDDASFVETFKREAQAVAKLNHPNIAQIYSFGQAKGQPYIVMELIKGRHLDEMIEEEEALSQALILRIIMEIASGLDAANDIGLMHGDIKPENILLDDKGHSKLVDFGLATFVDQQAQEGIWGTPYYIAPEKVRRHRTDARSDIYSLGATMFHALTGHPPFEGNSPVEVVKARLEAPAPAVSSLREDVNPDVERIVARMLEEEAGRRYPTYASLISDLKKTLEKLGPDRGQAQAVRGKKLVIRKKGAKGKAAKQSTGRSSSKIVVSRGAGLSSSVPIPHTSTENDSANASGQSSTSRSKAPLVILILLLIFGLIGGGVYFGLQEVKKRKEQAQIALQQAALKALHDEGAALCDEVGEGVLKLMQIEKQAMPLYDQAAANVLAVDNIELAAPQPPPPPEAEAVATPTNAPAVATNAVATNAVASTVAAEPALPAQQPDSLIMSMGRRVVEACATILRSRMDAEAILGKAKALNETLQGTTNATDATEVIAEIERLHGQVPMLLDTSRRALASAKAKADETVLIRKQEAEKQKLAREQAAEEARRRAEQEAAAQAAAAAQAKIDAELVRVQEAETSVSRDLSSYDFANAARTLGLKARDFQTDEGKAAIAAAQERYERLESMKTYFIKRLSSDSLPWGYVDGPSRLDILSANAVGLRIKSGLVPWREVSLRQMAELIKNLVRDDALRKGVSVRELADQYVNAAIFCALNGWQEAVNVYSKSAINLLSSVNKDLQRLVPPLPPNP